MSRPLPQRHIFARTGKLAGHLGRPSALLELVAILSFLIANSRARVTCRLGPTRTEQILEHCLEGCSHNATPPPVGT